MEVDEEDRARLHAYLAGELAGRERRLARRHLLHCQACKGPGVCAAALHHVRAAAAGAVAVRAERPGAGQAGPGLLSAVSLISAERGDILEAALPHDQ
jgi:hypothetical protein